MKRSKVIVSVTNDLYTDNRVNKVCLFLQKQGYDVLLVGRRKKDSKDLAVRPYATKRFRLIFEKGFLFYATYNFRLFWFLVFNRAELLLSNDLDTLPANYLANKFKRSCRLVYDTHEYFTEVPELQGRPFVKGFWERIENWIFPKLETVYTVNNSIANIYSEKYKKDVKVVRNVSPKWNSASRKTRQELGLPEDKFIILLQGAGINVDRGAEEAVEAVRGLHNVLLLILGDGDAVPHLKTHVASNSLSDIIMFLPKKPYFEMMQYTACADLGLTLDKPSNLNYRFSLPNKLFDYIHAGIPVICTDLPEVAGIVRKHEVGVVLNDLTVSDLRNQISILQNNSDKMVRLKANCAIAAEKECWEKETETLQLIYPNVD
ncbi:MAG: glycosyltransferase [Cryomorphaceae bacterium]|jgi:glycosyltransferase involved in cell wall biosynthesis|nr:glycosyltransferase [Cryomorphaceae bacterium]